MSLKQGTIIKVNFNPQLGHEQAGYRPSMVVSNSFFNQRSDLILVVPITNTIRNFPTRVNLSGTQTTGQIICEQVKSLDLSHREFRVVEQAPTDVINRVLEILALLVSRDSD